MKNILIALFLLTLSQTGHTQSITDTAFHNVIEIAGEHVATDGTDFLLDVSIAKTAAIPVIFIQARVPLNLLPNIYPEFSKIIVIVPNWSYYDISAKATLPKGIICAEPMISAIVYQFDRENGQQKKDSLILMGKFPGMTFNKNNSPGPDEAGIYFTEGYGSVCCPRDPQRDNKPGREVFIAQFEKENNVTVRGTYREIQGKEGEAIYYYTLEELPATLKLQFIQERAFYRIINRALKDMVRFPRIYTPTVMSITDRMKKI